MKKFILFVLATIFVAPMFADEPKKWNFTTNDEGDCVEIRSYPTNKDAQESIKAIKVALNKQVFETKELISENENELVYKLKKNTKKPLQSFCR